MKGYKTTIFSALLVMFGALLAALPDLRNAIPAELYPYILMTVGGIVHALRTLTSTPIFTKEEEEPAKKIQNLIASIALAISALVGALYPTPAPAETVHPDGSVTLPKEEVAVVNWYMQNQQKTIEVQGAIIREQQKRLEELQKGKCS